MSGFALKSEFAPCGDQPDVIRQLSDGLKKDVKHQTLLGVTGSGKTFSVANIIQNIQKPTLVLAHNKTLAAQLYEEFCSFFPNNSVEYFVSYYDYYQPEAYIPASNTYIEKELSINSHIERLRMSATSSLLSGRKDVIVVCSVSCLFGMGSPIEYAKNSHTLSLGYSVSRQRLISKLVEMQYSRTDIELKPSKFRVRGDTIDIFPSYTEHFIRIHFWGEEIERIESLDPQDQSLVQTHNRYQIFPANLFVYSSEVLQQALRSIEDDLNRQLHSFQLQGKAQEAKRLKERTELDVEMLREIGYCSGIENYSRYLDNREEGQRSFCLLDYFPDDYLMVIDESHVTIPQVHAMYGGDRSRKETLVSYGFRLPAALDNRPLKFEEFESLQSQVIYVSATPADYELKKSEGFFAEQIIRPTGLLDPVIEVRPCTHQVDNLLESVRPVIDRGERILVTTLTKKMAEELHGYMQKIGLKSQYIHSDVETLERVEILRNLREGFFDILIGVNLLREGLDLPEVSLVAILDADKEGFLRSERSLVQTSGRASRNVNGKVIMYADKITQSMQKTIDETERRRTLQINYNKKHGIIPTPIKKKESHGILSSQFSPEGEKQFEKVDFSNNKKGNEVTSIHLQENETEEIAQLRKEMKKASEELRFIEAAQLRDKIFKLQSS